MKKLFVTILYVLAFSFAHIVSAQTTEIDYDLWLKQSQHVERQLENDDVSESLRKQVADWRVLFQSASEANRPARLHRARRRIRLALSKGPTAKALQIMNPVG